VCWRNQNPKDLYQSLETLAASLLHCIAESSRSFTAIRKGAGIFRGSYGRARCLTMLEENKPGNTYQSLETLAASLLHWRAESSRSVTAIRKDAGFFCGVFPRKVEAFAYAGLH
jgi:hypothetical protein